MVYKGCAPETTTDKANPFPTYYRVRYCDYGDHQEYHVLYDVFFPFVSGCCSISVYLSCAHIPPRRVLTPTTGMSTTGSGPW